MYCGVPLVLLYSSPGWNMWARPKSMSLMLGGFDTLSDSMIFSGWMWRKMLCWKPHLWKCSVPQYKMIDVTKYTYLEVKVGNVFAVYESQSLQYLLHEFNSLSFQQILFLSNEVKQLPSTDTKQKSVLMRYLLHFHFFPVQNRTG